MKFIEESAGKKAPKQKIEVPQIRVNAESGVISFYPIEILNGYENAYVRLGQGEASDGAVAGKLFIYISNQFERGQKIKQTQSKKYRRAYIVDKEWANILVKYSENNIPACYLKLQKLPQNQVAQYNDVQIYMLSPTNIEQPKEMIRRAKKVTE